MTGKQKRKLGLVGGVSWHSTLEYYRLINRYAEADGDQFSSAEILLSSLNFADFVKLQKRNDLAGLQAQLEQHAQLLEKGGAEVIGLASNTAHLYLNTELIDRFNISTIFSSIARYCRKQGWRRIGILGTKYIMVANSYTAALEASGLEIVLPDKASATAVNAMIFQDLIRGNFSDDCRLQLCRAIDHFTLKNVDAVILGCTELPLLLGDSSASLPTLDSLQLHCKSLWQAVK